MGEAKEPCFYCKDEPEPGRIEMPNNGPIVTCPICEGTGVWTRAKPTGERR